MLLQIALRKKASALTALVMAAAIALTPFSAAHAQAKGPPVLRDTETEQLLREYTRPILRAAGLEKQNIQMVILNDNSFNAFVADGRRIFVNTARSFNRKRRTRSSACSRMKPAIWPAAICPSCASSSPPPRLR